MTADEALKLVQFHAPFPMNVVGPRGGNLKNPQQYPEHRKESFHGSLEHGLHRFVQTEDKAYLGLKNEQPWHRMAAYMLNAGRTNSEIAMAAGVKTGEVGVLRQQRWFQELCATIANNDGEEVLGALKAEALDSIAKLAQLRDFGESEAVQASCARTLLEQAHGKPLQKIVSDVTSRRAASPREEMEQLTEELAALREVNP
jgi:hypothetical protein